MEMEMETVLSQDVSASIHLSVTCQSCENG